MPINLLRNITTVYRNAFFGDTSKENQVWIAARKIQMMNSDQGPYSGRVSNAKCGFLSLRPKQRYMCRLLEGNGACEVKRAYSAFAVRPERGARKAQGIQVSRVASSEDRIERSSRGDSRIGKEKLTIRRHTNTRAHTQTDKQADR